LEEGIIVTVKNGKVTVDGLNLGHEQWVNVRYKVQFDTDNYEWEANKLYPTNGTTTLTPKGDDPDNKHEFPEPEASTVPVEVSGQKIWIDYGIEDYRPDKITVQLIREINGEDVIVAEKEVKSNGTNKWEYKFDGVYLYDTNGKKITYKIKEIVSDEVSNIYESESGEFSDGTINLRNILKNEPEIQLVKTGESTSEYGKDVIETGKDINYTFEITNTGILPLKDITLTDELPGMSEFTYETLNGEPFTGDIAELILQPGDVLVATASYEVAQEDFNHGQVDNHAEVKGTSTVPEPDQYPEMAPFEEEEVTDDDDASVPGELEPSISLTKTADKENVTEAGETITYTFEATNTGNTTLTDVTLTDDMLGGDITLEKKTLNPGESTTATATYDVTQEDINAGDIVNEADVEGTPPPAYTENPDNPDKVTDEDDETVEANQTSEIELVKEADKEELVEGETITYTFTATNTGNTTLTQVEITDILDGISDIDYLTVNGDDNFDKDNIVLKPGDVLVATATYE